jgi:hypothetical protein|tara:strand:- start:3014 stop:3304 length:291 start_codon:yes stop_codon:yes gene_type:complete
MPQVQRKSDKNNATPPGIIDLIPQATVFANNLEVAVDGSMGTFHYPWTYPHKDKVWKTTSGSGTVFANNIPVNRQGDPDSCGHVRIDGSPDVFADG